MLNNDVLSQLKQLKSDIRQHERRHQGLVSGSQHSFGFVRVDQGQQFFLPPLEMQKVFPGDRIEFQVKTDDQGRDYASVQKLISTELKQFCGKCVQHGKAWFVEMDVPRLKRKLFLPPPQRKGVSAGDWLQCLVSRHPLKEGKGQAAVIQNLGQDDAVDFPGRYAAVNFVLPQKPLDDADSGAQLEQLLSQRTDCSELVLVSIDPPAARDIDDALYARPLEHGWELIVAIADPGSVVEPNSAPYKAARQRAATAYLPQLQLPMLAPELSEDKLSLLAGQRRPAILCRFTVAADGEVIEHGFERACIRNRAQMSYTELNSCLEQQSFSESIDADTRASLLALEQVTGQMRQWRNSKQLLSEDKPEFEMILGTDGRIAQFKPITRGVAQRMVEECMLATNQAAARQLADYGGIFSSHAGFRSDKLDDAANILREAGLAESGDLSQLDGYRAAISYLAHRPEYSQQKSVLSRLLQRACLSPTPRPHLGMGVSSYASFTSPLRRYADLFNHIQLKRQLQGQPPLEMEATQLEQLELQLTRVRSASYWAEQWLRCEYLERHGEGRHRGTVVQANPFGLVVRLDDNGIEGIVEKRSLAGKMKFSPNRLRFSEGERSIGLNDPVEVELGSVQRDQRRILLKWCESEAADT